MSVASAANVSELAEIETFAPTPLTPERLADPYELDYQLRLRAWRSRMAAFLSCAVVTVLSTLAMALGAVLLRQLDPDRIPWPAVGLAFVFAAGAAVSVCLYAAEAGRRPRRPVGDTTTGWRLW